MPSCFKITLARACWQVRADHLRTIGRTGGVGYVSSLFCLLCNAANTPLCPFAGSRIAAKQFQFPRWMTLPADQSISVPFCDMGGYSMDITRRTVLAGAAAATSFTRTAFADWEPSPRYPDPTIKVLDPSFLKYRPNIVGVERLATGMTWSEGPVWFGDGRYLLWSDTPN